MQKRAGKPPTRGKSRFDTAGPARDSRQVIARANQDWSRLGRYLVSRRVELGYERQADLAGAAGVALRTVGTIERGDRVRATTLAKIEQALGWKPGSADKILRGGEPDLIDANEVEPVFDDPHERAIWDLADLDADTRWDLIRHLRERRRSQSRTG